MSDINCDHTADCVYAPRMPNVSLPQGLPISKLHLIRLHEFCPCVRPASTFAVFSVYRALLEAYIWLIALLENFLPHPV